jgi:hypothetical protein
VRRDEHDPFGEKKIPCDVRLKDYSWRFNKTKKTEGTYGNHETGQEEVLLLLLLLIAAAAAAARRCRQFAG